MRLTGWGNYPHVEAETCSPISATELRTLIGNVPSTDTIARGMGRSYGDSSLAARTLLTGRLDHLLAFDETTGRLTCEAGITLDTLLNLFVPRGWFLPVTPGTRFVSVGGAIASDVHGKNHHIDGSFCDHVDAFELMLASGEVVTCTPEQHGDLFRATCGGMGLTGIVLSATFRLRPIGSDRIAETTLRAANLDEVMALFDAHAAATYSVAWIDCLASGPHLGRSLLMLGEHESAESGKDHPPLSTGGKGALGIPFNLPGALLNRHTVSAFNALYYRRMRGTERTRSIHYAPFFYPLDGLHHWNRMYGRQGFVQYQFVLPREAGREGMASVLKRIAASGRGSFLSVLKAFGKGNDNPLSFPREGYTLALDFKMGDGLLAMLDELDRVVLDHGGRLYLTKDSRMSEATFKASYPQWERFAEIRSAHGADTTFNSSQSRRLGL